MGIGSSLFFIAIGAVLAFATHVTVNGIDIQAIGWILMLVGVAGMIFTLMYVRPRRRAVAEVIDEEPVYLTSPVETEPYVATRKEYVEPVPPHVHPDPNSVPPQTAPPPQSPQPGETAFHIRPERRTPG